MTDKTALVTGASSGIGRLLAQALAAEGYGITGVARREPLLQELVEELGDGHRYLVADLSTTAGVEATAADIRANAPDLLVNNAGYGMRGFFHELSLERQQHMLRVNCDALVALSHAFLSQAKRGDALLNIASALALIAFPSFALYTATKSFVASLSEGLWYQYKDLGIYVGALCPGATYTDFFDVASGDDPARPPKSIMQTPEQAVAAALRALKRRDRPIELTGGKYPMIAMMPRIMSRKRLVNMMGDSDPVKPA